MSDQLAIDFDLKAMEHPNKLIAAAYDWIVANPAAWDWLVGAAQRDALDGVPVSPKFYIEFMRRQKNLPWATQTVKLPNAFSPAFARFLREWHPELAPFVHLAPSKLDGCTLPNRPY